MKCVNIVSLALRATVAVAGLVSPKNEDLEKRASVSEACNIGYCTQGGGTTGGAGGTTTTVSNLAQFTAAAGSSSKMVIVVSGAISGSAKVKVTSDKTIIGAPGSSLNGIGLSINKVKNVIIRNMKISKVVADNGDAIGIQKSNNVWVDHCDLSSDMNNGKDHYDGLCDITHACEWVTVSNTYFHDHYKGSLVGHSDNNAAEDTGHLHITYANNYWNNINSRTPSFRFGTGHIFNSYFNQIGSSGINTRMGAQVLVESSVFENAKKAVTSDDSSSQGSAVLNDVNLGGSANNAPRGSMTANSVPYKYSLLGSGSVKSNVMANAGQKLTF